MRTETSRLSSFTLVEILVVVGVIGILGGLAYVNITGVRETASETKLRSDVQVVNRALDAYRASGGMIPEEAEAAEVLLRLKSRAGADAGMLAFTNAFIDPRTKAIWQGEGEAGTSMLRALYTTDRLDTNAPESTANPKVPRFYVTRSGAAGIKEFVFDEAEATNVATDTNRAPMLARSEDGGWVWDYTVTSPVLEDATPSVVPDTANSALDLTGTSVINLNKPIFDPPGAEYDLGLFPLTIRITSPNPPGAWAVYYATQEGVEETDELVPPSAYALLSDPSGALVVEVGTYVWAYVASLDPTRFRSSPNTEGRYGILPHTLTMFISAPDTVSYPQVTATNPPRAEIRLQPTFDFKYAADGDIQPYYSTGPMDPYPDGVPLPNWSEPAYLDITPGLWTGTNTTAIVNAMAKAIKIEWFKDSPVVSKEVGIELTDIPLQILPKDPVGLPLRVAITNTGYAPPGGAIYYTLSGVPPLSPADGGGVPRSDPDVIDYASTPGGFRSPRKTSFKVIAQATLPGQEQWFTSRAEQFYQYIGVNAADLVGLNILGGDVNGVINGNVYLQASGDIANINASGRINGNLYVPGYPRISDPNIIIGQNVPFDYDVVRTSTSDVTYISLNGTNTLTIPKSEIGGAVYNSRGQKIPEEQALDPRQIVDDIGSDLGPAEVKINPGGYVDGKIFRNVDVPDTPDIPVMIPPFPTNTAQVVRPTNTTFLPGVVFGPGVTNMPTNAVPYTISMTNRNAVLVLGTNTTPLVTNRYFFNPGTWTDGRVEIQGPVEIFFSGSFANTGVQFGTNSTARSTVIYVTNGSVSIGLPSASKQPASLFALVDVRSNTFTVDNSGVFYGGALTKLMSISKDGFVDVSQ
jgi:prepilin-type N-terminal cleavage/methylation domain-containing protein